MKCNSCINCSVSFNKKTNKWYVKECMKRMIRGDKNCLGFEDAEHNIIKFINK